MYTRAMDLSNGQIPVARKAPPLRRELSASGFRRPSSNAPPPARKIDALQISDAITAGEKFRRQWKTIATGVAFVRFEIAVK